MAFFAVAFFAVAFSKMAKDRVEGEYAEWKKAVTRTFDWVEQ